MNNPKSFIFMETFFDASIYYDTPPGGIAEKIEDRIICLKTAKNVKVNLTQAGPCWGPYVTITADSHAKAIKHAEKVFRTLKRYKGVTITPVKPVKP